MEKIKLIKDCGKYGKIGEIKNISEKGAESAIKAGVAESVTSETNITEKEIEKNSIENNDVTNVTDNTHITNVTHITNPCVTFVVCDIAISQAIFKENLFEQLLKFFYENIKYFTYDELAKSLNKSEDSIRQLISRKKEYFDVKKPDGKICHIYMSQMAVDEINQRIALKQQELEKIEKKNKLEKEKKDIEKVYNERILNFIQNNKPKRENGSIIIDFSILNSYEPALADLFLDDPTRFISVISNNFDNQFEVKIINLPKDSSLNIEDIREKHLDKLLCIEGRITSFGEVKPVITSIKYECPSCGSLITIEQNYRIGKLREPKQCSCGRRGGFKEVQRTKSNSCFLQFEDLQDKTENPHSQRIKAVLFNNMCEKENIKLFTPGNELKCTGILKEVPVMKGKIETPYLNWIFEVMSADLIEKDIEIDNLDDEQIEKINILSKNIDENGLSEITTSFAPDIFGNESIKEALVLQLCNKRNDKRSNAVRNKSNILLIGDPGSAKSVICNFAVDVMPGARKAVGGGSSAVGITASVIKDEESMGGYRVEPGAMILAKDLLFIDELNNLQDEDKPKLQEGMNEMTISIDKANIHVKMKVTSGIIACANPKRGSFIDNGNETIQEQFNIPTPILNRFDTIFVVRDFQDLEKDKNIAKSMLKRHRGKLNPTYDRDFLRVFFSYIKKLEEPEISEEIAEKLSEVYSSVRCTKNQGVKINPRFLESLTRMIIASAKIRQSKIVELKDIDRAMSILSESQYNII